jgi:hypothetical protein
MRKFAANFVVSESGKLLKNGILIANDDGTLAEMIDTGGDLGELAQLTFLNGILFTNSLYISRELVSPDDDVLHFIAARTNEFRQITIGEIIDIARLTQTEFPELKIPQIFTAIYSLLTSYFDKENQPGVFLLTHSDLIGMHFKAQSRLKRIL